MYRIVLIISILFLLGCDTEVVQPQHDWSKWSRVGGIYQTRECNICNYKQKDRIGWDVKGCI